MRYGMLGDIHSNIEALGSALEHMKDKIDCYISVGDIVGYGANPNECVEKLRAINCKIAAGNHDYAVAGRTDYSEFAENAIKGINWTKEHITKENGNFLFALDLSLKLENFTVVHSDLSSPGHWQYVVTIDDALKSLRYQETPLCFIGHTHHPVIFRDDGMFDLFKEGEYRLDRNFKYLINVGSIGQPRDGIPGLCAVIYDSDEFSVNMKRIPYDIQSAQEKILKAGLPPRLAERLAEGK